MSDPFNIVGDDFEAPPKFGDAFQAAVSRVQAALERFEGLAAQIPVEAYTEEEWRIVERADEDVADAVEKAEEGFIAVAFDSHAWYRIMENLEQVSLRLEGAVGVMERVRERLAG